MDAGSLGAQAAAWYTCTHPGAVPASKEKSAEVSAGSPEEPGCAFRLHFASFSA